MALILLGMAVTPASAASQAGEIGRSLPLWSVVPFVGMLLSLALLPLVAPHFWHRFYGSIAAGWALLFVIPFVVAFPSIAPHELLHVAIADYLPFLVLLGGLYTITGGILVSGSFSGTPAANAGLLLAGTALASWIGTTGASMLLIRPLLRSNATRQRKAHTVVFFIVLVSNVGGSLTPIGDPPLFLGFLRGVPFTWTLRLLPATAFVTATLLLLYLLIDRRHYRRERGAAPPQARRRFRIALPAVRLRGARNLWLMAVVVGAVLQSGLWSGPHLGVAAGVSVGAQDLVRDLLVLAAMLLSLAVTPAGLRAENGFSWEPIREVALLFAGIFATMVPAVAILRAGEAGALGPLIVAVERPWQYFWASGLLSSVLDNAPTYLTFFHLQLGRFFPGSPEGVAVTGLLREHPVMLEAVSMGAVYMGANTYIGNAPNFMVRSIAEEAGVAMPSFLGYVLRWTLPVLLPVWLLTTWIFLR